MSLSIGLDLGASNLRTVLLQEDGKIVNQYSKGITSITDKEKLVDAIIESTKYVLIGHKKSEIKGIGIGAPGPINIKDGKVLNPPNIKPLRNLSIVNAISHRMGMKTFIENDSNCMALGEALYGAGKEHTIVLGVTIGTGIGGGIVVNKKIYAGAHHSASEFGHMVILPDGLRCSCGNRGCWEEYVSSRALKRMTEMGSRELIERAKEGGEEAGKIYEKIGYYLGLGLANIVNIADPSIVVIGGGLAHALEYMQKSAKETMAEHVLSPLAKTTPIVKAKNIDYAGAIGAACLPFGETAYDF